MAEQLVVHRAADRFLTRQPRIETWHSFSFGAHYDPANIAHGPLLAFNDENLLPGAGFGRHAHAGVEIVTYVVSGALLHDGSVTVGQGRAQRLDASRPLEHSEANASAEEPLRFLQSWLLPGPMSPGPAHEVGAVDICPGWTVLAAGGGGGLHAGGVLGLSRPDATLAAAHALAGDTLQLPAAAHAQLFVVSGSAEVAGHELGAGDALRCSRSYELEVVVGAPAELLLWRFDEPDR